MKHTNKIFDRIVVKIGTSSLVDASGMLDRDKMTNLVDQLVDLAKRDKEVVLVSSGAIRAGMEKLGLEKRPQAMPELQASAAVGQGALMQMYAELLSKAHINPAQVLVTRDDFHDRVRYLNVRNTVNTLLRFKCLPIVNENDSVATDEIKFGQNDTLAALVAASIDAQLLVNLSDVDGLYTSDPRKGKTCELIEVVEKIDDEIERIAGSTGSECGSGGMRSKLDAATIAVNSGVRMVVANASRPRVIVDAAEGISVGTTFLSNVQGLAHRKRWIAYGGRARGSIIVNEGAGSMIREKGKSLLAVGVTGVDGKFDVGDMVRILQENDGEIGRGIVNYSSSDIDLIKGKKSSEIEKTLGYKYYDEVVHRDNFARGA